jgi:hypothetical protein
MDGCARLKARGALVATELVTLRQHAAGNLKSLLPCRGNLVSLVVAVEKRHEEVETIVSDAGITARATDRRR